MGILLLTLLLSAGSNEAADLNDPAWDSDLQCKPHSHQILCKQVYAGSAELYELPGIVSL